MFTPGNLIVCNGPDCTFAHLIKFINILISDLVILSTMIATAVFVYAGFLLLTSGGDEGAMKKAKDMFWKVIWGFVWIIVAWVVVYTIMRVLVGPEYLLFLGE